MAISKKAAIARLKRLGEKTKESAEYLASSAATVGTAAVMGYAQQRFGDQNGNWEVMGMNVPMVVGLSGLVVGFTGWGGKASLTMGAAGAGSLAVWAAQESAKVGAKAKQSGNVFGASHQAGRFGAYEPNGWSSVSGVTSASSPYGAEIV